MHLTGRRGDYTRLVGLVGATMLGATAIGSVASGLLASIDLILPFLIAGVSLLAMLGAVLTFKEAQIGAKAGELERKSYRQILKEAFAMMRARPALRSPMLYLALVPVAALMMETFFLQPQAVALGVPITIIGVLVMATQFTNMAGSTLADRTSSRLGEGRVLYLVPGLIILRLILLATFQVLLSLLWIAVISFATTILRPLVLNRIQGQVSDTVRATILSMQSLMGTMLLAVTEPILGFMADRFGLPVAYIALASGLGILILFLFWTSYRHLLPSHMVQSDQPEVEA